MFYKYFLFADFEKYFDCRCGVYKTTISFYYLQFDEFTHLRMIRIQYFLYFPLNFFQ